MSALKNPFRKVPLIGEVLVEMGLITKEQLDSALKKAGATGNRIGSILLSDGTIRDTDFYKALAKQQGLQYQELRGYEISKDGVKHFPQSIATQLGVLPLKIEGKKLTVAISDPSHVAELNKVAERMHYEIEPVIATESGIKLHLGHMYRRLTPVDGGSAQLGETEGVVNQIIKSAISHGASDIHIEPQEKFIQVRERIDGILEKSMEMPLDLLSSLVSRIKILADLDIAEKRNPQDGRFMFQADDREVDLRISTMPTIRGEKVVLRILDKNVSKIGLDQLGLDPSKSDHVRKLLAHPHGIILVSGPTGSGKTTTVYSMLLHINSLDRNIITVEDPVEYKFDVINQVQVNNKAGLGFSKLLRNILRQDPDVIMVGEIRDKETAEIAVRSALTGHLVISTVHTNDAATAVTRLVDMGIDPYLISSSLLGVIAQRLVRRLCPKCKTKADNGFQPQGCEECYNSGYQGREGIYEVLTFDKALRKMIKPDLSVDSIRDYLQQKGFKPMREDGLRKVSEGTTSMAEVLRVTTDTDI